MKKSSDGKKWRTNEEKIALIQEYQRAKETGKSMEEFVAEHGLYKTAIYSWMRKLGDNPVEGAREIVTRSNGHTAELKQLRIELQRCKMIIAEKCLDIQALQEYAGRK